MRGTCLHELSKDGGAQGGIPFAEGSGKCGLRVSGVVRADACGAAIGTWREWQMRTVIASCGETV